MPFGLYHAPFTFECCVISIFFGMIEQCIEVFMDNFLVFGFLFGDYLANLTKVLQSARRRI